MSSPQEPGSDPQPPRISRGARRLIIVILGTLLLLSLYANVQRLRRNRTETVTFTPAVAAPSASPSASPR